MRMRNAFSRGECSIFANTGAENVSAGPHENICPLIREEPCPSITWNTALDDWMEVEWSHPTSTSSL